MRRALALVLGVVLTTLGCGGDQVTVPQRQATPLDPATTGSIRGVVRLEGTAPPMKELPISRWPGCVAPGGGPALTGDMVVKDGLVQNAFVYVKSGLGDRVFAVPSQPVEVDQAGCVYVPRVVGAQVGQPVLFKNSDPMMHNVRGVPSAATGWNVSLANKGQSRTIQVDKPEVMISVKCDVHPWMQAYVGVLDHPYFAVTDASGRFELGNVPAGEYTLAVWHERFGAQETKVTVTAKAAQDAQFTLRAPAPN